MAALTRRYTKRRTQPLARENNEHVILADCHDNANVFSSQMAYYNGTITNSPQDVAVVKTNPGQTAVWFGQTTTALFTTTGTTFKVVLNGTEEDGDLVGTGDNGYGSFYCYQKFYQNRYLYGGLTCNMVVDCNHNVPTAANTPSNSSSSSPGLSTQVIIGISVGAGVACILLALVAAYYLWRHYRGTPDAAIDESGNADLAGDGAVASGHTTGGDKPPDKKEQPAVFHELPGHYQGTELTNRDLPVEIYGMPRAEVEMRPERFSFTEGGTMDFRSGEGTLVADESPVAGYLGANKSTGRT